MLAAIRIVPHPDGIKTSSYKYLPTSAHITLMAFIMKHIKFKDQINFNNKQNKVINSSFTILNRFVPNLNNEDLLSLLEDFCNRTLTTQTINAKGEIAHVEATTFISAYTYSQADGRVTIEVSYRLIPFILYIKQQYIGERWKYSASFTSSYSTLIYDMVLTSFDKNTQSIKLELNQIKDMLGIQKGTYDIYSNFKRKVLTVAINEINNKSDLVLEILEHKINRKVEALELIFSSNSLKLAALR